MHSLWYALSGLTAVCIEGIQCGMLHSGDSLCHVVCIELCKGGSLFEFYPSPPPQTANLSFSNFRFILTPNLTTGWDLGPVCVYSK